MRGIRANAGPSHLPALVFERRRLTTLVENGVRGRATVVVAPPGYGKSILVRQWAAASGAPIAWLDLTRGDGDAVKFAARLTSSLALVHPELGGGASPIDVSGRSLGDDFVDHVIADFSLVPGLVLVMDNFEVIRNAGLLADIATLVERMPRSAHVVVISRSDPPIGLGGLRLHGELAEIRADDLRMTPSEAANLLTRVGGAALPADLLDLLVTRTEGWPAGLHLAALSMKAREDPEAFVSSFSGDDRNVADYLTDEVLATRSAEERAFLVETSVLERLSGPLCDHVTGRPGGAAMLQRLERDGMLLVRLDPPGGWYRYHSLLRDLLRAELDVAEPGRRADLLRRAAEWHLEQRDVTEASGYLADAQAWEELFELARVHGRTCFEQGTTTMLRDRLLAAPDEFHRRSASSMLTIAILRLLTGHAQVAEEDLVRLEESRSLTVWERAVVEVVRSSMVSWHVPPARALEAGDRAIALIDGVNGCRPVDVLGLTSLPSLRAVALESIGRANHYLGRVSESRAALSDVLVRTEGVYLTWFLHALGALALLESTVGNLREAEVLAARVLAVAGDDRLIGHPATAEAYLAIARLNRERDRLDDARFALAQALPLIRANHRTTLLDIHGVEEALLALAAGRPEEGVSVVRRCLTDGRPPAPPLVRSQLVAAAARCHLAHGSPDQARRVLAEHSGLRGVDVVVAEIALAVAGRDLHSAAERLAGFDADADAEPRALVELRIWSAVAADSGGRRVEARGLFDDALRVAEPHDLRRPFLDAGAAVQTLMRSGVAPTGSFVRSIVEPRSASRRVPNGSTGLVEELTQRELAMLSFLPTRLSNVEIGQRLYISTNTVKTHLKRIYRKLDVTNRSDAIARAESIGLL